MAISRLAISNPGATTDTLLYTATRSALSSIIATNKASTVAEVRVWIVPQGQDATPANWSYIAYDADITATNSLETFRFPVMSGDKIYVRSTTADVSFQIMGIYETGADTYVYAQATQPTAPQVGDIWVDTASDVPSIDNTTVYRWSKTAVGGETSLSGAGNDLSTLQYIAGYEQVYLNGVLLAKDLDYFATNGTSITSLTALSAGDIVEVISPYAIELTDVYTKSVSDAKYNTKVSNGLNLVVPTGAVFGTGTGNILANGQVNFSNANTVSINNCFSSNYDNYEIIIDGTCAVDSGVYFQMRSAGVNNSSSYTIYSIQQGTSGTPVGNANNTASSSVGHLGTLWTTQTNIKATISNPFKASPTHLKGQVTGGNFQVVVGSTHTPSTSFDGFHFYCNAGNISGTIRIYGYNNGGA
jgi:hypothetical protein